MSFFANSRKGFSLESYYSQKMSFLNEKVSVLVSPQVLRSRGCGQVDLACFDIRERRLTIYEVKSSNIIASKQFSRLRRSSDFLSHVLNCSTFIKILSGR